MYKGRVHAGKGHLGPEGAGPEDHGFDVNRAGIDRGGPYGGKKYFSPYGNPRLGDGPEAVSYTHLRAHETVLDHVCRPLLEKNNTQNLL